MTEPLVELRPAYTWTCEECGRDQYHTLYIFTEQILENVPEDWIGADPTLDIEMWPSAVVCKHCETSFTVGDIY